jgi:2-oxoglutarate dehydrogenase E1 component
VRFPCVSSTSKNRTLIPITTEQLKAIIALYPNADDYVWGTRRTKEQGYSFMLMNFNLIKWRLASQSLLHPAPGSYTRAKRRHADAIKMVFDKDLFR